MGIKVKGKAITSYCRNNGISYSKVRRKLKAGIPLDEALEGSELRVARIIPKPNKEIKFNLQRIKDYIVRGLKW